MRASGGFDVNMRELGLRLRQLRHERGETLDEISKATGISVAMLSRIETGQRHPSPDSVLALARHFGLAAEELMSVTIANRMVDRYGAESSWLAAERIRNVAEAEGDAPRQYGVFSEMPIGDALAPRGVARADAEPQRVPPVRAAESARAARPHRDLWVPEGTVADEAPGLLGGDLDALSDAARVAEVALQSAMAAIRRARSSGDARRVAEAEQVLERLRRAIREG